MVSSERDMEGLKGLLARGAQNNAHLSLGGSATKAVRPAEAVIVWLFTTIQTYSIVTAKEFGHELQAALRVAHLTDGAIAARRF